MNKNQKILMVVAIISIFFATIFPVLYIKDRELKNFERVKYYMDQGDFEIANNITAKWQKAKFERFKTWYKDKKSGKSAIKKRRWEAILTLGKSAARNKSLWIQEFEMLMRAAKGDEKVVTKIVETYDDGKKEAYYKWRTEYDKKLLASKIKTSNDNIVSSPQIGEIISVISEKAYFYKEADESTIRKAYLINGDKIEILLIQNNFVYCEFTNSHTGKVTKGWIKFSDIGL